MDWTGNQNSAWVTNGISHNKSYQREADDFYATEPKAVEFLTQLEPLSRDIWECACGQGHISEVLIKKGFNVKSTDLVDRGYGEPGVDFLKQTELFDGDIVTNPPYKYAQEFVEKTLELVKPGHKVCMFLKLQFMESNSRRELFLKNPPKTVWVACARLKCGKNGNFKETSHLLAFAWYVWEKGFDGNTTLKWFN